MKDASSVRGIVLAAAMLMLGGCAASGGSAGEAGTVPQMAGPSSSAEECMFSTFVDDWAPVDDYTFILYGPGRHEAYLGRLAFPAIDMKFSLRMGVVDDDRNGRICGQSMDSVTFIDPVIPGKIFIRSLKRITEEEAQLLIAESKKPKEPQEPKEPAKESPPKAP
jgi:Family of unknown function (DUF6491)